MARSAKWADLAYIRILHLSATTMQGEVEAVLATLLEQTNGPMNEPRPDRRHRGGGAFQPSA